MARTDQTVFVVDDDGAVRKAVSLLLRSVDLEVEPYASGNDFLAAFDDARSGCLVLDIRMAEMSGLEVQEKLRERRAILPIIFMTGHGDVSMAVRAMQAGAMDFLEKPFRDQDLLDRVHKALELDARNRSGQEKRREILGRIARMTPREREIMNRIVDGSANKAVAFDLGISERTVEIHRARVMSKMSATSFAHLVQMVMTARK